MIGSRGITLAACLVTAGFAAVLSYLLSLASARAAAKSGDGWLVAISARRRISSSLRMIGTGVSPDG